MSIQTRAPILPFFMVRKHRGAHFLHVGEPLAIAEEGSLEERIQAGVARYLEVLEGFIRRYPSQWLWLHRRWKSSPEKKVLLFSDGKAGHAGQLTAFAQRLERAWRLRTASDNRLKSFTNLSLVKAETVQIRFRHPILRFVLNTVASVVAKGYAGGDRWLKLCLDPVSYQEICSRYADWAVSCGSATSGVSLLWSWGIGTKAIQIYRSGLPSWKRFSLAVVPRHDFPTRRPKAPKKNLVLLDGVLAPFPSKEGDEEKKHWRQRLRLEKPRVVGLFVGGPAKGVTLTLDQMERLLSGLKKALDDLDAELLVTTSRRTPPKIEERLKGMLENHPRCRLLVLVNQKRSDKLDQTGEAVECILRLADAVVVSGDSISMVSEAVAVPKPVVSFLPSARGFRWGHSKHRRFLLHLQTQGKVCIVSPEKVGEAVSLVFDHGKPSEGFTGAAESDAVVEQLARWL